MSQFARPRDEKDFMGNARKNTELIPNQRANAEHSPGAQITQTITTNITKVPIWGFGIVGIGLIIVSIVIIVIKSGYNNSLMGGQLNVVVEPFLEEKNGHLMNSDLGMRVSQLFYSQLENDVASGNYEHDTGIRLEVRSPQDAPPLKKAFGQTIENSAEQISADINAQIVVYGVITYDNLERPLISVRFYISSDQFGDAQELLGENELGNPILLTGNLDTGEDLEGEHEELRNRIRVVSLVIKAIGAYIGEDFPLALSFLEKAIDDALWKKTAGREVIYLLAGNAASRYALPTLLADQEDSETKALEINHQAEIYYQEAIIEAMDKGDYSRAYIGLAGVENFIAMYKARITGQLSDVDLDALDREEQYLAQAVDADYKPKSADIAEKVYFNLAQISIIRYQFFAREDFLLDAEKNYLAVIESYEHGNLRVRELCAHSHSGLALIERYRKNYKTAIDEYLDAYKITQIPSLQALYLYTIGNVYYENDDYDSALRYYKSALDMREDLAKRIPEGNIQIIEDRIQQISLSE